MADDPQPNADQTQLNDLDKDGKVITKRIGSAAQAQEISNRLIRDDTIRANRRLAVQGQYNGNAPVTRGALKAAGREGDCNLNWKENKGQITNAWSPFFDVISEVPVCIDGNLEVSDPQTDADLMRGIAEYFHEMVFGWDGFDEMNQLRDLQMLLHGVGILVWEDEWTWFPRPILASNFYLPDKTRISLDNGEELMVTKPFTAGELYRKIINEKQAEAMGWFPSAVKAAIIGSGDASAIQAYGKQWDRWEQAFKNGDLYVTQTQTKEIPLSIIFVQEMNGTISELIVEQMAGGTASKDSQYLYYAQSKYKDWSEAVCLIPYDMGADATFHSIKGLGTELFPFCTLLNKVKNELANLVATGIRPMWQPQTGGDIEKFAMTRFGNGNLVPQGFSLLDSKIGSNLTPALEISREFTSTLAQNTGTYTQNDISAPTVDETAKAATIRAAERAKLSKGAFNRFMRGISRQYRQMFRRASNPKLRSHHPNSEAALKFQSKCRRLCAKLQVPWLRTISEKDADMSPTGKAGTFTVLEMVQDIEATRTIGLGSPAMRLEIASQLMQNIDRFDEIGQNEIKRFYVSAMTGYHTVDAIVPSLANSRDRVNDESVAANEDNGFAMLGPDAEAFVVPGQNHVVHLSIHIPSMQNDMQLCQQGQQDPRECAKRLEGKGPHAKLHLDALQKNPTKQREFQQFQAQWAEVAQFQSHLEQMIQEQNDQAAQQPQSDAPNPEMVKVQGNLQLKQTAQEHKFALMTQKQQFDQALKAQQAEFDKRLADLQTASHIHRENAKTSATISNDSRLITQET